MWGSPVRKRFEIEKDYHLICGLSLGYPDKEHTANQYRPTKRTLEELKSPLKQPE
jgi:nitroreductase